MKIYQKTICFFLALCALFPLLACGEKSFDPENNALIVSATDVEGVFSPFFATNSADREITANTQITMFSVGKNGEILYGENEPVVALDMAMAFQDERGEKTPTGSANGKTLYQFVIKKNIKFSDGKPLTIKDALFNLYVYLDPINVGSSAVYSTKIDGLQEYRAAKIGDKNYVPMIKGITAQKGGKFIGEKFYDNSYDILQIKIDGVDPKAIWNFNFSVAPLRYYSSEKYLSFKYPNVDITPENYLGSDISAGFPKGDAEYFRRVIQGVNKAPVGAGAYKCSAVGGNAKPLEKGFYSHGRIYFERNEYFVTTGGNAKQVYNAKIKYLQYKEVDAVNILAAVKRGGVYYSELSCTESNVSSANASDEIGSVMTKANGYGYIGISAKYVPNINIRRAIMSCFDVSLFSSYYPGALCEILTAPLSTCSWIYDDIGGKKWCPPPKYRYNFGDSYEKNGAYAVTKDFKKYMSAAENDGYYKQNGKWFSPDKKPLKYVFTIAGGTDDHPSYQTLSAAAKVLNAEGFNITLKTDSQALAKLSNGDLAVWSAAWSSSSDPDMYEKYHINAKSASVKAWGYPSIKERKESEDYKIVTDISALIDSGRATFDKEKRKIIYREALDKIMDLAVEFPSYNRRDLYVWNKKIIDEKTLTKECSSFCSPFSAPWKVEFR